MANDNNKGCGGIVGMIVLILLALALFVFAPGISIVLTIAGGHIDRGQAWTFGIIVSVLIWLAMLLFFRRDKAERPVGDSFIMYGIVCALTVAVYAVAHFGFHADWPSRHLNGVLVLWDDDEQETLALRVTNGVSRLETLARNGRQRMNDREQEESHNLALELQDTIKELAVLRRRQGDKLPPTWDMEIAGRLSALAK